tara:strand:+ start:136 stop:900 length:765 start_codon:yes stop_codon:yes gene_type:complete
VELFDVSDDRHAASGVVEHVMGTELRQPMARTELGQPAAAEVGGRVVLQVALGADRLEVFSVETTGMDDRTVRCCDLGSGPPGGGVLMARSVTTLTPDCLLVHLDTVVGSGHRLGSPRMTDQAVDGDRTFEREVTWSVVSGCESPAAVPGVPGDRALDEEAVELDEIGPALVTGPDDLADRMVADREFRTVLQRDGLLVPQLIALAVDTVTSPGGGVLEFGVRWLLVERDVGQSGGMRRLGVGVGNLVVALCAG